MGEMNTLGCVNTLLENHINTILEYFLGIFSRGMVECKSGNDQYL
jgi:hypothetical protein